MNLKKKIVALGLVCALALGMATSAFADYNNISYRPMRSGSYSYNWLNVNRSNVTIDPKGKNLILWNVKTPGIDQKFHEWTKTLEGRTGTVICFADNPSLAVNRSSSTGSAILWTWNNATSFKDSALSAINRWDSPQYELKYGSSAGQYLRYASDTSGARVYFSATTSNTVWDN